MGRDAKGVSWQCLQPACDRGLGRAARRGGVEWVLHQGRSMLHACAIMQIACPAWAAAARDGWHDSKQGRPAQTAACYVALLLLVGSCSAAPWPVQRLNAAPGPCCWLSGLQRLAEGKGVATPTLSRGVVADAPHCSCSCCSRKDFPTWMALTPEAGRGNAMLGESRGAADGVCF
jgi:hypothetical protein